MYREIAQFGVGNRHLLPQYDPTSFLPGGVCNKAVPPLSFQAGRPFIKECRLWCCTSFCLYRCLMLWACWV